MLESLRKKLLISSCQRRFLAACDYNLFQNRRLFLLSKFKNFDLGFAYAATPGQEQVVNLLNDFFYPSEPYEGKRVINMYQMARELDVTDNTIRMILAFLDIYHDLCRASTPKYAEYKIKMANGSSPADFLTLLESNCDNQAIVDLITTHYKAKKLWGFLDMDVCEKEGKELKITRANLVGAINSVERLGECECKVAGVRQTYIIHRTPTKEELATIAETETKRMVEET